MGRILTIYLEKIMTQLTWTAEARTEEGKGASRRLRRQGKIPAIIYGLGKPARSIALSSNLVERALQEDSAYNTWIEVVIDGGKETVVIKDLQRNPAKEFVTHLDLQRVSDDSYIVKRVPFEFVGTRTAPGVKMGGLLTILQATAEIRAKAKELPTKIVVDISHMEAGSNMRLSEIALPEGVEFMALRHGSSDYDQSVVKIGKVRIKA